MDGATFFYYASEAIAFVFRFNLTVFAMLSQEIGKLGKFASIHVQVYQQSYVVKQRDEIEHPCHQGNQTNGI